jgi:SPP1 gp7 family putative phage head morphogenesis protein
MLERPSSKSPSPLDRVFDRVKPTSAKSEYLKARKVEALYGTQLRKIARHIGDLVKGFNPLSHTDMLILQSALRRYGLAIEPWARSTAWRMITEVAARDKLAWRRVSAQMGVALKQEIETAPTGQAMRQLLDDQVMLITSLPIEAAQRVHELALQGITEGSRGGDIVAEIMRTGEVTKSRAVTIARTETARTASVLTQVRAVHIGSTHYTWSTVGDSDVRPDHKALNGGVFAWNDPPIADTRTGARANPGCIYNCRCIALPIIPAD